MFFIAYLLTDLIIYSMNKLSKSQKKLIEFVEAVEQGDLLKVRHLLKTDIDVNKFPFSINNNSPLSVAVAFGHSEIVKALLSAGAYPYGYTLLQLESNSTETALAILSLLIDAGIDVNFPLEEADTILMKVAGKGNLDLVKLLVEAGANVNQTNQLGESALMYAVYHPWLEVYEYLYPLTSPELRHEAEKELPSRLLYRKRKEDLLTKRFIDAARFGNVKIACESIVTGVNINSYDAKGDAAIHIASQYGHLSIVNLLIKAGADIEFRTEDSGQTPLILAASDLASAKYNGYDLDVIKTIRFLVKAGANVNTQDNDGWTPLIGAANAGSIEAVKILIKAGANVNAQDNDKNTALSLAKEVGNTEIVKLLIEAEAKD